MWWHMSSSWAGQWHYLWWSAPLHCYSGYTPDWYQLTRRWIRRRRWWRCLIKLDHRTGGNKCPLLLFFFHVFLSHRQGVDFKIPHWHFYCHPSQFTFFFSSHHHSLHILLLFFFLSLHDFDLKIRLDTPLIFSCHQALRVSHWHLPSKFLLHILRYTVNNYDSSIIGM